MMDSRRAPARGSMMGGKARSSRWWIFELDCRGAYVTNRIRRYGGCGWRDTQGSWEGMASDTTITIRDRPTTPRDGSRDAGDKGLQRRKG